MVVVIGGDGGGGLWGGGGVASHFDHKNVYKRSRKTGDQVFVYFGQFPYS